MSFRFLILLLLASTLLVNSFPIGKDNESDESEVEVDTTTEAENIEVESQEASLDEQLNEVSEDPTREKRGLYSSERTEEEVEISHGMHHREKRHSEHLPHPDPPSHTAKRSTEHHRVKRSEGHPHEKKATHSPEGHIVAKDDHHGHEKRSSDSHHGHQKRSVDEHHGHQKKNAEDHHEHQKRSEHVEHQAEMHEHQKRSTQEVSGHPEHHLVKRSGGEGGHRHHRSTDQGLDEDEPEDEIQTDENDEVTEEPGSRKRRNTDTPMPSFPSDHDSEHSNSVAIRVKRVSRAGSSHKVRTLNKNRGNSKAGETTQNDSLTPNSGGVFNS
ncbi:Histidine-rich glycoprotein-like [Caenorhabditis elegans]|uniref:Histidine-rich glycoprotein-like n=1 Tax=Caenorhabditis elegans TaxID=6239 RepID=Q22442_CAEEL|nr:Histidine-rich glycoprotein-like [Caenorhabditis elegans]CCD72058.1 Histidine-rich glycoprotein-like [Caenorhabditis elegans]|eukprot:NP_001023384.1 Neuropeptide-Like Protein [Caenorhabditis elegans]